ncbi:hypothetical protein Dsin_019169 [Dipteronia sinensis]|uniref:NB-ARC domain-containing protein n=1 Tax=Dipteronia sinensis TaxID=43782 RepID=A0AAE0E2L1_9ROSI|nr:hypothetical protein Dsin_019169 [Dipteronia sinensis]
MNVQKNFYVHTLSNKEAWNMFVKIVGDTAKNCDFNGIAVEVVQKCAGLLVAVATIANALKNKSDLVHWKDASRQLGRPITGDIEGMDADVYSAIKLSYNFLENEEAKSIFLLCGLENAGYSICIEDLLRYCMGLDLFNDVDTLEEGRIKLQKLIDFLKGSCLLLDGNTKTSVKMHDIIHTVAGLIARSDKLMLNIQNITRLEEELEKKIHKETTTISLPEKDVNYELPERLEFPKLQLFFLSKKDLSFQIPDTFFEGTKELKVLDLTKIRLLPLPSSLCRLTNFQTLCLKECLLGDIAIIRKLKNLEILSFQNSDIKELPGEIK